MTQAVGSKRKLFEQRREELVTAQTRLAAARQAARDGTGPVAAVVEAERLVTALHQTLADVMDDVRVEVEEEGFAAAQRWCEENRAVLPRLTQAITAADDEVAAVMATAVQKITALTEHFREARNRIVAERLLRLRFPGLAGVFAPPVLPETRDPSVAVFEAVGPLNRVRAEARQRTPPGLVLAVSASASPEQARKTVLAALAKYVERHGHTLRPDVRDLLDHAGLPVVSETAETPEDAKA